MRATRSSPLAGSQTATASATGMAPPLVEIVPLTVAPWSSRPATATSSILMRPKCYHFCDAETVTVLGDRDVLAEVDVLDRVEQLGAFLHGALERLAPRDEAHAAGALVDHRRHVGLGEVVLAGGAAAVDQSRATHEAVRDLVATEVDRMIAAQVGVDALVELAVAGAAGIERLEAAVVLRQLLLDDVRLDGHAQVVGLAREVGGDVVVLVLLERAVAHVAPQDGPHAQL